MSFYQQAKHQAISVICSGDIINLKILQCDWLRTFWPISQEPKFSQIWALCRNTTNDINLMIKQILIKFFNKFKNPVFGSFLVYFPNFGGKKKNSGNPALSCTTFYRFLTPCQNLERTNDTIPTPRQMKGWTEGQIEVQIDQWPKKCRSCKT